jgi:ABC-2 type transport system ATP-binding protein
MLLQATLHGFPKDEAQRRAETLLERVGLMRAAERRVGTYSGGMRRRLDLGMALVHEPRVLFLDEPTTGLDPTSRIAIWDEVKRLNDEGTTVFLTTQYLEEADQLADRVGIIDEGRMAAEGTPTSLKAEVGSARLEVRVTGDANGEARVLLEDFGELWPERDGTLIVSLQQGAESVAPVLRALDAAGLGVESLDLVQPTLDDVFVAKTGHYLEGAEEATGEPAA